MYLLLFVALNQTPAQLGMYPTQQACEQAIRGIFATQLAPKTVVLTQQERDSLAQVVDFKAKIQREYTCLKQQ